MARAHVSLVITEFDHPKLELDSDTADDDAWVAIRVDEATTISGEPHEIRRWVQELAVQAAQVEV